MSFEVAAVRIEKSSLSVVAVREQKLEGQGEVEKELLQKGVREVSFAGSWQFAVSVARRKIVSRKRREVESKRLRKIGIGKEEIEGEGLKVREVENRRRKQ